MPFEGEWRYDHGFVLKKRLVYSDAAICGTSNGGVPFPDAGIVCAGSSDMSISCRDSLVVQDNVCASHTDNRDIAPIHDNRDIAPIHDN